VLPPIGDDDGGSLLPLVPREPGDVRGLFGAAAVFFDRSDFAWAAEGVQSEALWLLGPHALAREPASRPAPPPQDVARVHGRRLRRDAQRAGAATPTSSSSTPVRSAVR
jgi:hypothetical protein